MDAHEELGRELACHHFSLSPSSWQDVVAHDGLLPCGRLAQLERRPGGGAGRGAPGALLAPGILDGGCLSHPRHGAWLFSEARGHTVQRNALGGCWPGAMLPPPRPLLCTASCLTQRPSAPAQMALVLTGMTWTLLLPSAYSLPDAAARAIAVEGICNFGSYNQHGMNVVRWGPGEGRCKSLQTWISSAQPPHPLCPRQGVHAH